jgi:hypothetical protein
MRSYLVKYSLIPIENENDFKTSLKFLNASSHPDITGSFL